MKDYRFYGWETADIKDVAGLTPRDYYNILSGIWCAETCAPRMRDKWSVHNPTFGQCSITAFLMQDIFGGKVLYCIRWHYLNWFTYWKYHRQCAQKPLLLQSLSKSIKIPAVVP